MIENKNISNKEAKAKLTSLVDEIKTCLFCTNPKEEEGTSCRPMVAQTVCDQGNIWFYSEKDSLKNTEISKNNKVKLFFLDPVKASYLVVNGKAEIILDREKIHELWSPVANNWFVNGKDDINASLIKVIPVSAYYWNKEESKMKNLLEINQTKSNQEKTNISN